MSPEDRATARAARKRGRRIAKYVASLSAGRTPESAVTELINALKALADVSPNPMSTMRRARRMVDDAIATMPRQLFDRGAS